MLKSLVEKTYLQSFQDNFRDDACTSIRAQKIPVTTMHIPKRDCILVKKLRMRMIILHWNFQHLIWYFVLVLQNTSDSRSTLDQNRSILIIDQTQNGATNVGRLITI